MLASKWEDLIRIWKLLVVSGLLFASILPAQTAVAIINAGGVVNAADYATALAHGSILSVRGTNLAGSTTKAGSWPLPTTLDGVTVEAVDGGRVIAAHAGYTVVEAAKPADPNEVVLIFLTGLEQTSPRACSGKPAGDGAANGALNWVRETVTVTVAGQAGTVHFAGLAPGSLRCALPGPRHIIGLDAFGHRQLV